MNRPPRPLEDLGVWGASQLLPLPKEQPCLLRDPGHPREEPRESGLERGWRAGAEKGRYGVWRWGLGRWLPPFPPHTPSTLLQTFAMTPNPLLGT